DRNGGNRIVAELGNGHGHDVIGYFLYTILCKEAAEDTVVHFGICLMDKYLFYLSKFKPRLVYRLFQGLWYRIQRIFVDFPALHLNKKGIPGIGGVVGGAHAQEV